MNKDSIERLWDNLTPKLYGYLVNTLKDRSLSDDILQATWLKAIQNLSQFKGGESNFSAWLFAIARNEMRMHWRKSGREIPYDGAIHDRADTSTEDEDRIMIEQAMAKISDDDRELIRLRYIADLTFNQMAKVLKLNPITVRVRMHRALVRARFAIKN